MEYLHIRRVFVTMTFFSLWLIFFGAPVLAITRPALSDVNRDGLVNSSDTTYIGTYFSQPNPTGLAALADINENNSVDFLDLVIAGGNNGYVVSPCELEDINNDGVVSQADLTIVNSYLGQTDTSTNMIADMDGDGSITAADVAKVQGCIPAPPPAPVNPNPVPPPGAPNPNVHPNWQHEVMAGPSFVGTPSYLTSQNSSLFIDKTTNHDDLSVSFSQPKIVDLPKLPWSQNLNTVSEIVNISAVSAFNGYAIDQTDNPFTIILNYSPDKLYGLSLTLLAISHYDPTQAAWAPVKNPMIVDQFKHTVATTTNKFGYFAVTYPSSAWN